MSREELRDCPQCGTNKKLIISEKKNRQDPTKTDSRIKCQGRECLYQGPTVTGLTTKMAWAHEECKIRWNTHCEEEASERAGDE